MANVVVEADPGGEVDRGIQGVHHVSLTVSDLDRSVAWYQQVFGFEKVMDFEHGNGVVAVLQEPRSGAGLGLNAHRGHAGEAFDERRTGLDHLSFQVASRSQLEVWDERLERLGVERSRITDVEHPFPFSVLVLRDPDGIQLELIAL